MLVVFWVIWLGVYVGDLLGLIAAFLVFLLLVVGLLCLCLVRLIRLFLLDDLGVLLVGFDLVNVL